MKKLIVMMVVAVLIMGSTPVFAGRGYKSQASGCFYTGAKADEPKNVRNRRMRRDLEKEYSEGSLTRTEYIQRRREIKALEK